MIKLQKDNDVQFEIARNQLKKYNAVVKVFASIKFCFKITTNQYSLEQKTMPKIWIQFSC